MNITKTPQIQKQSQFVTLVLDMAPDEKENKTTFNEKINISFDNPDGFYVRQILCTSALDVKSVSQEGKFVDPDEQTISYPVRSAGIEFYNIYTDLVNNYIGSILSGSTTHPNTYFRLNKNVNDTFLFRIDDLMKPSITGDEIIVIMLEFVKN